MATPLIPFTLAWLIGIWHASRAPALAGASVVAPKIALGVAAGAATRAWRRISRGG